MRNQLLFWAGLLLLLLLLFRIPVMAQYQDYEPLKNGFVTQYIARDSIYSIESSGAGVIDLNKVVKKGKIRVGPATCIGNNTAYHEQLNNQFGEEIRVLPGGEYSFVVASGTTFPKQEQLFLLKTRIAVGTTWLMNASANLSASLVSKSVGTFCGVSDSVLTYNLSDGKQIVLSKNYGLVQAPNFPAYVANSDFKKRVLQLYKLPESTWANTFNSPLKIYDFQPNDRFSYYRKDANSTFYTEELYQNKILTRRNSPGGDSIYYTVEHRKLTRQGLTFNPNSTGPYTAVPTVIQNLIITADTNPELNKLTNGYLPNATFFQNQDRALVNVAIKKYNRYHQREVFKFTDYAHTPSNGQGCGNTFYYSPDVERYVSYGYGLGKVYDFSIDSWPIFMWDSLTAYVKGTETYGVWPDFNQIMGAGKQLKQVPFAVFPNPFGQQITLKLSGTFKAEKATVSVSNVLGAEIYSGNIRAFPGEEIKLDLPGLTKGIYLLQLSDASQTYSCRLMKE